MTLVQLSSAPTAVRAAANCFCQLLVSHSDNNVKLIVLDRLQVRARRLRGAGPQGAEACMWEQMSSRAPAAGGAGCRMNQLQRDAPFACCLYPTALALPPWHCCSPHRPAVLAPLLPCRRS